jgi:crotonobetainyl-CoA:carnitine CoA-transferase CaiB-like acyl-CoA transferase
VSFLPLQGVRVVDVTTSFAGPYCTMLLAALGADVVKVEPLSGDEARSWGPPFAGEDSALFVAANAGKRSLALDLRRGRDVVLRLVDRADVFIQSLRPGLAEERGLGAEELGARNPRLVYCSITSFGREGPWAARPGYDPLAQAAGGILSVTGEPEQRGVRVGVSLIDQGTAMWAALGIMSALLERERTGAGRVVDVSLYETALAYMSYHLAGYLSGGEVPGRHGTAFPSIAPYQAFVCSDSELMVAVGNDRLFAALCEALGVPELAADERFATNPDRVERREELAVQLGERFAAETRATWLDRLERAGVPAAPVQNVAEVAAHEQTRGLDILQPLGEVVIAAPSLSVDCDRVRHRSAPPALGAHTAKVLSELGYSDEEVAELAASGAVRLGNGPAR